MNVQSKRLTEAEVWWNQASFHARMAESCRRQGGVILKSMIREYQNECAEAAAKAQAAERKAVSNG